MKKLLFISTMFLTSYIYSLSDYMVCTGATAEELRFCVRNNMQMFDWKPHGSIVVDSYGRFHQPLILE
jgi:hypothetical protein